MFPKCMHEFDMMAWTLFLLYGKKNRFIIRWEQIHKSGIMKIASSSHFLFKIAFTPFSVDWRNPNRFLKKYLPVSSFPGGMHLPMPFKNKLIEMI